MEMEITENTKATLEVKRLSAEERRLAATSKTIYPSAQTLGCVQLKCGGEDQEWERGKTSRRGKRS